MKKFAAILLTLILLFNAGGYRLVIDLMQQKADNKLEARLDNSDYDESQLIEMRVSLNMPYQNRNTDFERHYGEINIDGKVYTYVKSKVEGDVLVLKCIANESKEQLKNTADNLAKSNGNQEQDNNKKQSTSLLKIFSGDFDDKNLSFCLSAKYTSNSVLSGRYSDELKEALLLTPYHPPKSV